MRIVYQNGEVELIAQFTNGDGDVVDPDTGPFVAIFDANFPPSHPDTLDSDALVLNASQSSLGDAGQQGTNLVERISTGLYRYRYTVPLDGDTGTWYDRWTATLNSLPLETVFSFSVLEKITIESITLENNQIITVTLDETIADEDGNELGSDQEIRFATIYTPFYASADLLSMEIGSFITGVPEFTLNLLLHWSSIDADANIFIRSTCNSQYLEFIKTRYVLCRSTWWLLNNTSNTTLKSKSLGDLSVTYDNGTASLLNETKLNCEQLRRILNSGGNISEGASLPPIIGIKGGSRIDRPLFGRDYVNAANTRGGGNSKVRIGDRGYTTWDESPGDDITTIITTETDPDKKKI